MRKRINPRAVRILVTMIVCLGIFKAATIVSNADSLPGVEYRSCQSEIGWTQWKRNSEISGEITNNKKIEALKIILTDIADTDVKYKAYVAGKGWSELASNGITVGGTEGIQAIRVSLCGELESTYSIVYRVHMLGGEWTEWIKGPEVAGDIAGTRVIDGIEIVLVDSEGQKVVSASQDYSADLPATENQSREVVQETTVEREDISTQENANEQAQDNIQENVNEQVQDNMQQNNNTQVADDIATKNIDRLLKVVKEELGYTVQIDKTTKYGNWWANKVGDDVFRTAKWSSMFLAWCGDQAGLTEEQYGFYASSQYWKNWFVSKNAYHTVDGYTPKIGDIIFMDYDDDGESNHNGIVTEVMADKVITIEGNVEGVTNQCEYALNDERLMGYGTPFYGQEVQTVIQQDDTIQSGESTRSNPSESTGSSAGTSIGELERLSTPVEGIDVSVYNTVTDWASVAKEVDFAYIRVGFRNSDGSIDTDPNFAANIKGALDNGIKVGVYFFTQAITEAEAEEEAAFVLDKVKNYNLTYPIVIDSEKASYGFRTDSLSKDKRTRIIKAFMDKISAAGYRAQLYSGKCFLYEKFNMEEMVGRDIWVAHYRSSYTSDIITDFKYPFSVWQYSDRGRVNGISGDIDKDLCYVKY